MFLCNSSCLVANFIEVFFGCIYIFIIYIASQSLFAPLLQEDAGGGLVFWHPNGAIIRHLIEDSWKKIHLQHGYKLLYTPHVAKADLWKISGHLDFYRENMYDQMNVEDELYQLRPMNCPYHILYYKSKLHSYKEFPIRFAELGTVYRYELSGSLHGLFRVRGFTQVVYFCGESWLE